MIEAKSARISLITRLDKKTEIQLETKDENTAYVGITVLTEAQLRTLRNDINNILND